MLKRIYDWCIDAAHKPYALWIMGAVAFAESSFFPVPPDVMLIPMSLARPQRAWLFAALCTVASVAGGVLGYAIGALLYDSLGQWLIHLYGLGDKVEAFRASYAQWGALIIIGKGLTPIPYKLVTITSGFAGYNIWLFILCSIIARGGRFFVVAVVLNRYGDVIRTVATSDTLATSTKAVRIEAYKLQAFSYCVSRYPQLCQDSFSRILALDPAFVLAPNEAGHPVWGPAFQRAQAQAAK